MIAGLAPVAATSEYRTSPGNPMLCPMNRKVGMESGPNGSSRIMNGPYPTSSPYRRAITTRQSSVRPIAPAHVAR